MRVLHLAPLWYPTSEDSFGGIETYLPVLIDALARLGCEQSLLAAGDSHTAARLIPVTDRMIAAMMDAGESWEMGPYEQHELALAIETGPGFDIVHSHLGWGGLLLSSVPQLAGRVLHTLHNPVTPDVEWFVRRHPRLALTVVSEFQARKLRAVGSERCEVIPNGLAIERFPFSERHEDKLAFLGRMEHGKGPDLAIRVARALGRRLVLAGPTPDPEFFHGQIEPALGDGVEYAGILGHSAKCELFAAAACTLMPSRWDEPFGLVAIESQACGTPVVALPNGALPEVLEQGVTGYLAAEDDFADAVAPALALDRGAIRRYVEQRFGMGPVAARYMETYERMAGGSP
jgi:glycosyltransferase involved in cell wall biosynthesis